MGASSPVLLAAAVLLAALASPALANGKVSNTGQISLGSTCADNRYKFSGDSDGTCILGSMPDEQRTVESQLNCQDGGLYLYGVTNAAVGRCYGPVVYLADGEFIGGYTTEPTSQTYVTRIDSANVYREKNNAVETVDLTSTDGINICASYGLTFDNTGSVNRFTCDTSLNGANNGQGLRVEVTSTTFDGAVSGGSIMNVLTREITIVCGKDRQDEENRILWWLDRQEQLQGNLTSDYEWVGTDDATANIEAGTVLNLLFSNPDGEAYDLKDLSVGSRAAFANVLFENEMPNGTYMRCDAGHTMSEIIQSTAGVYDSILLVPGGFRRRDRIHCKVYFPTDYDGTSVGFYIVMWNRWNDKITPDNTITLSGATPTTAMSARAPSHFTMHGCPNEDHDGELRDFNFKNLVFNDFYGGLSNACHRKKMGYQCSMKGAHHGVTDLDAHDIVLQAHTGLHRCIPFYEVKGDGKRKALHVKYAKSQMVRGALVTHTNVADDIFVNQQHLVCDNDPYSTTNNFFSSFKAIKQRRSDDYLAFVGVPSHTRCTIASSAHGIGKTGGPLPTADIVEVATDTLGQTVRIVSGAGNIYIHEDRHWARWMTGGAPGLFAAFGIVMALTSWLSFYMHGRRLAGTGTRYSAA